MDKRNISSHIIPDQMQIAQVATSDNFILHTIPYYSTLEDTNGLPVFQYNIQQNDRMEQLYMVSPNILHVAESIPTKIDSGSLRVCIPQASDKGILTIHATQLSSVLNKISSRQEVTETITPEARALQIKYEYKETSDDDVGKTQSSQSTSNDNGDLLDKSRMQKFVTIHDRIVPPRAVQVLPTLLQYRRDVVTPRQRRLPPKIRFGPVQGIKKEVTKAEADDLVKAASQFNKPVFLLKNEDGTIISIDVSDRDKSNWISLLPLGDKDTANVWLKQEKGKLHAFTVKSVPVQTPLRLGYTKEYADQHAIPHGQPILDLNLELSKWPTEWCCTLCPREMSSLSSLEKHMKVIHKEGNLSTGRLRHSCYLCNRKFSRLFALRRHQFSYCRKKKQDKDKDEANPPKDSQNGEAETTQNGEAETTQNGADESRLPSDESMQNYTNILDISTNLFDTDRISNLDLSGSLKSESDLINMYMIKDDSHLASVFDFDGGLLEEPAKVSEGVSKQTKSRHRSSSPFECPDCRQKMKRSKLKQHSKICPSRVFKCTCGNVFRSKQKFAQHLHLSHPAKANNAEKSQELHNDSKSSDNCFTCHQCGIVVKRRGMYINHMVRAHGFQPPSVPLVVTQRQFPCPGCPKLYAAKAKRDKHVATHHPGIEYDRSLSIPRGCKRVAPASCGVCSRQYATRAKLLQHVRKHHPQHNLHLDLKRVKTEQN